MALQIHTVSIETITLLRPLVARIRRFDLSLAKQISRSASSVALNIGEGEHSSGGHAPRARPLGSRVRERDAYRARGCGGVGVRESA
ncbi:MAG: hypothetical protein R3B07_09095 [Polyangiaceae bacterium]